MIWPKGLTHKCDNHERIYARYSIVDKYGRTIHMCEKCRIQYLLESIEILVCQYCDVIVRSEDDPRAKFESNPHKVGCPRYVAPRVVPKFEDFGFYEDSRYERKHRYEGP